MTIPEGWAEFNDANAVFRGRMVAATGTFSGTFASDNVEAVTEANIRNGAVSAYYGFDFAPGSTSIEFALPPQKFARVADIIAPIQVSSTGVRAVGYVHLYKNGVLYKSEGISQSTSSTYREKGGFRDERMVIMQVVRFIDFEVSEDQATTYSIVLQRGSYYRMNFYRGTIDLNFLGNVVVGCRKR